MATTKKQEETRKWFQSTAQRTYTTTATSTTTTTPSSSSSSSSTNENNKILLSQTLAPLEIPALGFGTWKLRDDKVKKAVAHALRVGYRHIDTAHVYQNEEDIAQVLSLAFNAANNNNHHNSDTLSTNSSNGDNDQNNCTINHQQASSSSTSTSLINNNGASMEIQGEKVQVPALKRSDVWITTKLWNTHHEKEHVREACEASLKRLGLQQLDLYLMHWPVAFSYNEEGDFVPDNGKSLPVPLWETWHAMEDLVRSGLTRYIGVSNFGITQLAELLRHPKTTIRPAVNQIELHPRLTQTKLVQYCQKKGILVQGYSPLGSNPAAPAPEESNKKQDEPSLLNDPVVRQIAEEHGTQPTAVLLRWQLQQGFCTLPRSQSEIHIYQNFLSPYTFALTDAQMDRLNKLNRDQRYIVPAWYQFDA